MGLWLRGRWGLHAFSTFSASVQSISSHATPKRQGSEVISVLRNLFETLSRFSELTGEHTARSRGPLHIQFTTKSGVRTRIQTASRQGTFLENQSNLPTNAKQLQATHMCVNQRKKAGMRN